MKEKNQNTKENTEASHGNQKNLPQKTGTEMYIPTKNFDNAEFLVQSQKSETLEQTKQGNAQTPPRVINHTPIFHAGWSQIRSNQLRSGRTRTPGVEERLKRGILIHTEDDVN